MLLSFGTKLFVSLQAPDGESQPSTEVDLFISTEKIMVLNTDLKVIFFVKCKAINSRTSPTLAESNNFSFSIWNRTNFCVNSCKIGTIFKLKNPGIELGIKRTQIHCSTNWANSHAARMWIILVFHCRVESCPKILDSFHYGSLI